MNEIKVGERVTIILEAVEHNTVKDASLKEWLAIVAQLHLD